MTLHYEAWLPPSLPARFLLFSPPASHRTLTFHSVCFPFPLYGIEIVQKAMMIRTADCRSAILTTSIKPGSKVPTCLISGAGRAADNGGPAVYLILFVRGSDTGRSHIVSHHRSCRRTSHTRHTLHSAYLHCSALVISPTWTVSQPVHSGRKY